MKKPLISIIIPFYNEEKYLNNAIESAIKQTYKNIEIILVNDGSGDNSKIIAGGFTKRFHNIQLINSTNEGPGAARNKGVLNANGELITFLDADDTLNVNMIDKMLTAMLFTNSEISICRNNLFDINGKLIIKPFNNKVTSYDNVSTLRLIYHSNLEPTVWGKLYKSSIIKTIKSPEGIWFEDDPFILEALLQSNRIVVIDEPLINIYSYKKSIVRRLTSTKRILDFNTSFNLQIAILNNYKQFILGEYVEIKKDLISNYISRMLGELILILSDLKQLNSSQQKKIKNVYLSCLKKAMFHFEDSTINLSIKKKIVLELLNFPRYFGWNTSKLIIYILKHSTFRKYKNLRGD